MERTLNLLAQYQWVYDFKLTRFFVDKVWENLPEEWVDMLLQLSWTELNNLPFGEIKESWPESFKSFVTQCLEVSLPREKTLDNLNLSKTDPTKRVVPLEKSAIDSEIQKGMSEKKLHEVGHMTALIDHVTKITGCSVVTDVGSGLGYLGQVLHSHYGHNVLGLEGKQCHTSGAEKRSVQKEKCPGLQNVTCELHQTKESKEEFLSLLQNWFQNRPKGGSTCCCRKAQTGSCTSANKNGDKSFESKSQSHQTDSRTSTKVMSSQHHKEGNKSVQEVKSICENRGQNVFKNVNDVSEGSDRTSSVNNHSTKSFVNVHKVKDEIQSDTDTVGDTIFSEESGAANANEGVSAINSGCVNLNKSDESDDKVSGKTNEIGIVKRCDDKIEEVDQADRSYDRLVPSGEVRMTSPEVTSLSKETVRNRLVITDENRITPSDITSLSGEATLIAKESDHGSVNVGSVIAEETKDQFRPDRSYKGLYGRGGSVYQSRTQDGSLNSCCEEAELQKRSHDQSESSCIEGSMDQIRTHKNSCNQNVVDKKRSHNDSMKSFSEGTVYQERTHDLAMSRCRENSVCMVGEESVCMVGEESVCMVGLHCCGDLTPTMLHYFVDVGCVKALCCVSCCYHRMKYHEESGQFDCFPMSSCVQEVLTRVSSRYPAWSLNTYAMRLAAQETRARWRSQSEAEHDYHCKNVAYRALLELCMEQGGYRLKKTTRRLAHRSNLDTFDNYLNAVSKHIDLPTDDVESMFKFKQHMMDVHRSHLHYIQFIEPFTALQYLLQPVLESLIMRDRQLWLQQHGYHSNIIPIFDEYLSPRNLAIVAIKC